MSIKNFNRSRSRRRAVFAMAAMRRRNSRRARSVQAMPAPGLQPVLAAGYDPELLYVECGRCGAPVLWDEGRATKLLRQAGIDPLELDAACILVTDACPACGSREEYGVRIFRMASPAAFAFPLLHGHA